MLLSTLLPQFAVPLFGGREIEIEGLRWMNPWAFCLLLLIPLWFLIYRTQRKKFLDTAFLYSPLGLLQHLKQSGAKSKSWLFPLWVIGLVLLLCLGAARPVLLGRMPEHQVNLLLVMDISLSMMADDIAPDRLEAAKESAARFVDSLPASVNVGLELFAGNNYVIQPPSDDHEAVIAYIKSLSKKHLQMRTEIGSALKTAVDVLGGLPGSSISDEKTKPGNAKAPRQVVILMSDGDSQEGYPWSAAVSLARERNIIIDTVGIGSSGEATIVYQGQRVPVFFNENTLRKIASASGGTFFRVFKEDDFADVYRQIKEQSIVMTHKREELGWLLALLTLLWVFVGVSLPIVRGRH
ncbi:MAG: VWA domain-containing protein [Vampirovibrionales bacterium]|nr:VWA domain-containing protein [Vampirovibrionales bacterium]